MSVAIAFLSGFLLGMLVLMPLLVWVGRYLRQRAQTSKVMAAGENSIMTTKEQVVIVKNGGTQDACIIQSK